MAAEMSVLICLNFDAKPKRGPYFAILKHPLLYKTKGQTKSYLKYMLEIALQSESIMKQYSWEEILQAI